MLAERNDQVRGVRARVFQRIVALLASLKDKPAPEQRDNTESE